MDRDKDKEKDKAIDETLKRAAEAPSDIDPALLDRVGKSIESSLRPVRPVPPGWALTCGLVLACFAVALAGAGRLGLSGIETMNVLERALIFPALGILIWLAATVCVSEVVPGSKHRVAPSVLLGAACLALLAIFAALFRDYSTENFVHQGVACLTAGVLFAIPAGVLSWLLLRRGFAVNPVAAGLVAGTLAGLAGVTMLELHCPNFEAPHVMLWHTAVIPVSAAGGALLAWAATSAGARRSRSHSS
jgi:hypothetical protein